MLRHIATDTRLLTTAATVLGLFAGLACSPAAPAQNEERAVQDEAFPSAGASRCVVARVDGVSIFDSDVRALRGLISPPPELNEARQLAIDVTIVALTAEARDVSGLSMHERWRMYRELVAEIRSEHPKLISHARELDARMNALRKSQEIEYHDCGGVSGVKT